VALLAVKDIPQVGPLQWGWITILAQVIANSENLLVRLRLGVYAPPNAEALPDARDRYTELWRATEAQLAAIKAFSEIDWRE
jgi:hypothetical protein